MPPDTSIPPTTGPPVAPEPAPVPAPAPDDDGDFDQATPCEDVPEWVDVEAQKRLWVRAILPVLQMRSHDSDPSGRVQLAFDLLSIAACEALGRILQSVSPHQNED